MDTFDAIPWLVIRVESVREPGDLEENTLDNSSVGFSTPSIDFMTIYRLSCQGNCEPRSRTLFATLYR